METNPNRKPGAERQAALKARRESAGFKRSTVWIKQADYDAGKLAAELGAQTPANAPQTAIGFRGCSDIAST